MEKQAVRTELNALYKEEYITCPLCGQRDLTLKYEVVYEYSYRLDSDAPGSANDENFHPYLYDDRLQKEARQYIACGGCGQNYACFFEQGRITAAQIKKLLSGAAAGKELGEGMRGDHSG